MRRFFVNRQSLASGKTVIKGQDAKHLRTVLRVRQGEEIFLFDETGRQYRAGIIRATSQAVEVTVLAQDVSSAESLLPIAIGQALLKGRSMDRIVRQLTELGVSAIFPFPAERSISRPDDKQSEIKRDRWESIAAESLKQCGRFKIPVIDPSASLEAMLQKTGSYEKKYLFHCEAEMTEHPVTLSRKQNEPVSSVIALVGPEGGFSVKEVELVKAYGFTPLHFGPRILKADTAAVAVAAVLQYAFGDLGERENRKA